MPLCLLALGANLGDPVTSLREATLECQRLKRTRLLSRSVWIETVPVGGPAGQNRFFNGALLLETDLQPSQLFELTSLIEQKAGRVRTERWGARTLDIDLLLYDQLVCETDKLVLPHPRMSFRHFVLEPAEQIAPAMIHPESGWTLASLLRHLQQTSRTVVVTAPMLAWAQWLATWLGGVLNCPVSADPALGDRSDHTPLHICTIESPSLDSMNAANLVIMLDSHDPNLLKERLLEVHGLATETPSSGKMVTWRAAIAQRGFGPRSRIRASDPETIQLEALAAIKAAWPNLAPAKSG